MRDRIHILIVEAGAELRDQLVQSLQLEADFVVIGTAADGIEAQLMINKLTPDVVLMDIVLPKCDGLSVLRSIERMSGKPVIMLMSYFINDRIERETAALGAYGFILKPVNITVLIKKLRMALNEKRTDLRESSILSARSLHIIKGAVTDIFYDLGIPTHLLGYRYLREAVTLVADDRTMLEGITKKLYPEVAKTYQSTASKVERAIRHCIETVWEAAPFETKRKYFRHVLSNKSDKPTNSEFIAMIAERIRLAAGASMIGSSDN